MEIFSYGSKEMAYLSEKDERMVTLINHYGFLERTINPDLFSCLVESIVAQQISGKAADTIYAKVQKTVKRIDPRHVLDADEQMLRACGLSARKISYLKSAANFFLRKDCCKKNIMALTNEDLIALLTQIKGVGIWTAEMLMIFSLAKPDILSYHDFGIRKSLSALYALTSLTKTDFEIYKKRFHPYASIASFYLWQYANDNCVLK